MYLVYLFKEKSTKKIIYVGSSSRPSARMKEHKASLENRKLSNMKLYEYMREKNLKFYKDIEIIWVDIAENKQEMYKLEEKYYFKYGTTVLNERPAENRDGHYNPRRRKVKCINDGREFLTVTECANFYNIKRTTLSNYINGHKKRIYVENVEFSFEYVN